MPVAHLMKHTGINYNNSFLVTSLEWFSIRPRKPTCKSQANRPDTDNLGSKNVWLPVSVVQNPDITTNAERHNCQFSNNQTRLL